MIFLRSVPRRLYADYTRYRPLLRRDFRYRCAYCLTHEFYVGGEAGCEIDHHRPVNGRFARPDLVNVYENLFWCCRECNQNKGDIWPSDAEQSQRQHFLDPCRAEDDHDLHWVTHPDGTLTAVTEAGRFTIGRLLLWRDFLVYNRARAFRWQQERNALRELLQTRALSDTQKSELERCLADVAEMMEPPVFERPRR